MAGFKVAKAIFGGGHSNGGAAEQEGPSVPIVAAGGEYVIAPAQVAVIGNGDVNSGHKALDHFVKKMRANTIQKLGSLPGPKRD